MLRVDGGEHQHQRVHGRLGGGAGGKEALVKELSLGKRAFLQDQRGLVGAGAEGELFRTEALLGVAPQVELRHPEALGGLDRQVLFQQVVEHDAAGAAAEGNGIVLPQLQGVGLAVQLFRFLLGADGAGRLLARRVGEIQLVDQGLVAGDGDVRLLRPGKAAGELEDKNQNQQQAQHHSVVLLHGNHLKTKE